MSDTLSLFDQAPQLRLGFYQDRNLSIQDRFEAFHAANPWVFEALKRLALDARSRGRTRIGIGQLTEVLRWEYGRATRGDDFKINNDFRSRYARLLMAVVPELDGVFETRELKTP